MAIHQILVLGFPVRVRIVQRKKIIITNKNYVESYKRFSKVTDKVKEIGKSIEHTVTHPKETGKKVVEYVKKHPDEAIILGTSDIVPGVVAAKLAKAGKTKQAAIAGTIAALPIGGAYVSGKIAIRKWNEKRKKNK